MVIAVIIVSSLVYRYNKLIMIVIISSISLSRYIDSDNLTAIVSSRPRHLSNAASNRTIAFVSILFVDCRKEIMTGVRAGRRAPANQLVSMDSIASYANPSYDTTFSRSNRELASLSCGKYAVKQELISPFSEIYVMFSVHPWVEHLKQWNIVVRVSLLDQPPSETTSHRCW